MSILNPQQDANAAATAAKEILLPAIASYVSQFAPTAVDGLEAVLEKELPAVVAAISGMEQKLLDAISAEGDKMRSWDAEQLDTRTVEVGGVTVSFPKKGE